MNKTLIIIAHPDMETSVINKRWLEKIKNFNHLFTVHELYRVYPDWKIDIKKEQALVEKHKGIILQFPLYWFNSPPLLKKWLDDVLTYGWAYGSTGNKLMNKKLGIAVSAGISAEDFSKHGRCGFTLTEILRPFEMMAKYTKANYQPMFEFYGAISEPGSSPKYTPTELEQSAQDYITYLKQF